MSDPLVYDSRSVRFKSPYGAVPSGTQVTFTLRPLRSEGYSRGKLTARLEQRDNQIITVELPWTDTELGRDAFSGVLYHDHSVLLHLLHPKGDDPRLPVVALGAVAEQVVEQMQ